jgi:2-keto-4-pentenoate hydratase
MRFVAVALALGAGAALSAYAGSASAESAHADEPSAAIASAAKARGTYPDVANDIDELQAYAIQGTVVKDAYGNEIAGFKAGLTSLAAQRRFGVDQPVVGVLPESGRLSTGAALTMTPGLKIEVEIGILVGEGGQPAAMLPVIELPRMNYADMKDVTLADIVATNVSAYEYISGKTSPLDPDVRAYQVSLDKDGKELFSAFGSDALGDPLRSYEWAVNKIRSLGYKLKPGMIVITGALGRVTDAEPGTYVARYGSLGELKFRIKEQDDALQAPRQ